MDEQRRGRLENWHEIKMGRQTCMFGNVYECGAFELGEEMITSEVQDYFSAMGLTYIRTLSGSVYQLGTPATKDKTFEQVFKEACGRDLKGEVLQ